MKDDLIADLSPQERDVFAEMIMRSLRGNWRNPRDRANILVTLGDYELSEYDAESIKAKAERYLETGEERGHWDGRTFRSKYGEVDVTTVDEPTVRRLASHIPHDMTWDDYRISKEFAE